MGVDGTGLIPKRIFAFKEVDFNGHIGSTAGGYGEVHGGFGFGERNGGGTSLLDFAKAFGLVISNSIFPKRERHLVTFQNAVAKTQIDYLLLRRGDRGLCKDCKRRKRSTRESSRIRWGALTKDKAQELEGWLSAMGAWRSSGDASTLWSATADCKVEAKKAAYLKLVGSTDEEERKACMERYKTARKEDKLAVTEAKTVSYGRMYEEMGKKAGRRSYSGWPS
ncbi:uncharacterized protein [Nicotiana tomentosiformis]|uniref:uncharacterized protein n=1 Tax=Nicotiana tomentosiformis TaxID=4098 RepID=UPI00388CDCA8